MSALTRLGWIGALGLGACTVLPPQGPTVVAMPGQGKSFEQFQADENTCRQAAVQASGGPREVANAANTSAIGSAAIGTGVGAAAGALLGSVSGNAGAGAAIGAGAGLLLGSSAGASNAQASTYSLQRQYDITYSQCMTAQGNSVQGPPQPPYAYGGYPAYVAPYPYYRRYYRPGPYPYGYP